MAQAAIEVELPRSIQGLIAARLDGLPADEKAVLQDAAVVGRVFWTGAVAALVGTENGGGPRALGRLRVKELVVPRDPSSFSGEHEFAFRHDLIRDGAYESLPKALRAEKHADVAHWADGRAGDRAEEIAELIATHHVEALRYLDELGDAGAPRSELEENAYRWARAAGDRASSLWEQAGAVRWYREALRLGEALGAPLEERASLARSYTFACWGTATIEEAMAAGEQALALYEELGDESGAGWAEARIALAVFTLGRDDEVALHGKRAVDRLESAGDSEDLAEALWVVGWYHWRRGDLDEGEPLLRGSMAVAERLGDDFHRAQAMHWLGLLLRERGRLAEALAMVEESFRLAKEQGDFGLVHRMYNNVASTLADFASDYGRAEGIVRDGIEMARKAGARHNLGWQLGTLGDVLIELGRLEEADQVQREAVALAEEVADEPLIGMRTQTVGYLRYFRGDLDGARKLYERAGPLLEGNPEPQSEIPQTIQVGLLAEARGNDEEAAASYARARGAGLASFPWLAAQASLELARLYRRTGRSDDLARTRVEFAGEVSPSAAAYATAVRGIIEDDPRLAVSILGDAAGRFEALGKKIDLRGACSISVALSSGWGRTRGRPSSAPATCSSSAARGSTSRRRRSCWQRRAPSPSGGSSRGPNSVEEREDLAHRSDRALGDGRQDEDVSSAPVSASARSPSAIRSAEPSRGTRPSSIGRSPAFGSIRTRTHALRVTLPADRPTSPASRVTRSLSVANPSGVLP